MKKKLFQKAYTIIEVLVVIALLGILMPAVFSILYVILQQQIKIYEITETKRQGDYIMQLMKERIMREGDRMISDADGIFESSAVPQNICNNAGLGYNSSTPDPVTGEIGRDFVFVNENSDQFQYVLDGDDLRYRANGSPSFDVTVHNIRVNISDFQIGCVMKSTYTAPVVSFSYTVTYNRRVPNPALGVTALQYQTKVKLRQ